MPRAATNPPTIDPRALFAIRERLLAYYDTHARDLPWRRTRDPYAIWVSEVMLQQTRVETVLRYYDAFLERFPSVRTLAAASEDAVLARWSGLGYYRRARMLHAGVREVVSRYGGQVPADTAARRALPGVGRYTAGAIGSIAFDRCEPLVDGNVARVFARLFGIDTPLGRADTEARMWSLAEALVQGPRPGALNQALMELGATLCSKAAPSCQHCPLAERCVAAKRNQTDSLPVARKRAAPKPQPWVVLVALDAPRQRVWLSRGETPLFGGLWNLPMRDGSGAHGARALLGSLGLHAQLEHKRLSRFDHVLTHRRLQVNLFVAHAARAPHPPQAGLRLQPLHELSDLGISSLTRRALREALARLPP